MHRTGRQASGNYSAPGPSRICRGPPGAAGRCNRAACSPLAVRLTATLTQHCRYLHPKQALPISIMLCVCRAQLAQTMHRKKLAQKHTQQQHWWPCSAAMQRTRRAACSTCCRALQPLPWLMSSHAALAALAMQQRMRHAAVALAATPARWRQTAPEMALAEPRSSCRCHPAPDAGEIGDVEAMRYCVCRHTLAGSRWTVASSAIGQCRGSAEGESSSRSHMKYL